MKPMPTAITFFANACYQYLSSKTSIYLYIVFLLALFGACNPGKDESKPMPEKPNIIFILTDDMGYETVSYNKVTNYNTPNIDKLAREAYVFTNCDAQPLCCPTRIKLVTGQYNYRNYTGWGSFNLEFPAIGKIMQQANYSTGVFGKWHMNKSPEELGFDEHCIFNGSPGKLSYNEFFKRYFYNCPVIENGNEIVAPYSPDKFNEHVLKFIDDHKQEPFFIYYPLSLAHNPFEPTPDSDDLKSANWQKNFEDMVHYADKMIGNVIEKLKQEGLYENTVIFYTSDNGTKTLAHEMVDGEVIYGMKSNMSVDGVHVPLFVKYDGTHKTMDDLIDFSDFYPTITSLAGISPKELSEKMDGVSFHPLLKDEIREPKPYIFSVFFHPLNAYIRDKTFKYYLDERLYNIQEDPRELKPYYSCNDTPETTKARKELQAGVRNLLNETALSEYSTKDKLLKTFGDIGEEKQGRMLEAFIFENLEFTPRKETIKVDITDYLSDGGAEYELELSRSYRASNAGLTYADVIIKSARIRNKDEILFSKNFDKHELTTIRDIEKLRDTGNPIISFIKTGDSSKICLGKIEPPTSGKIELEIELEVSNPDNQYGKQAMLYLILNDKKDISF